MDPVGNAGWPLTAGLTRPRSSASTSMNAKSHSVASSSPMKATEPNSVPSMSRTRWPIDDTQCAAVPRYVLPLPEYAKFSVHDPASVSW